MTILSLKRAVDFKLILPENPIAVRIVVLDAADNYQRWIGVAGDKMRKFFSSIAIFIFAFALIVCFQQSVKAEEDLVIPDWVVDAYLLESGDLQIVEDITFEFNDNLNGVFREIVLNKTSGVSDIQVQELIGSAPREYAQVEDAKKGDSDVFIIKDETDKTIIQIFSPSEDEEKTFKISYLVDNVAVKYNDIGRLIKLY